MRGWALVHTGSVQEGIEQLRAHREAYRRMHAALVVPYYRTLLADAFMHAGQLDEALDAVAEGLEIVEATGQRSFEAELYRLRGEILLAQDPRSAAAQAESWDCCQRALSIARSQGAKSLELRAAATFGRIALAKGNTKPAELQLAEILAWFREGQETIDWQEARLVYDRVCAAKP